LGVKPEVESKWPEGVVSEDDEALTIYFYEIPAVIWVDEKGCFFRHDWGRKRE
jgi:hypothetical protein